MEIHSRVTFIDETRCVRLVVDADGEIIKRSRVLLALTASQTEHRAPGTKD